MESQILNKSSISAKEIRTGGILLSLGALISVAFILIFAGLISFAVVAITFCLPLIILGIVYWKKGYT